MNLVLIFAVTACSSTKGNVLGEAPDGGGGDAAVTPPNQNGDAGTIPTPKACANEDPVTSIAGTWDIILSQAGAQTGAAVLKIDANSFSFAKDNGSLSFTTNGSVMTLVYNKSTESTPITMTRTSAPVDVGAIPLDLGGGWTFSSTTGPESCNASLGVNGFNASCNGVNGTPVGKLAGTFVGQRTAPAASIFGDLGGTWTFSNGAGGSAHVSIIGNTFTATANKLGRIPDGTINVKVCNGTVSGVTAEGFELAGVRQ